MTTTITIRANAISNRLSFAGWMRNRKLGNGQYREGFVARQDGDKVWVSYVGRPYRVRKAVIGNMADALREAGYRVNFRPAEARLCVTGHKAAR
jgi:predicted SPOUT superfamily RNA methylase MTH1